MILPRKERLTLLAFGVAALLLRAVAFFRYRFDSDEQQHLHVTWGWTAGLVQYRDLFDNHFPLFHLATAPLLAILGERPTILLWMRLPMLALFAFVVWATWTLGRRLYDERVAAWGALLLLLFPPFFLKSLEYRNDNLWLAFWMAALVVLASPRWTPTRRFLLAGLLLGLALCVSIKTVLLAPALLGAAILTWRWKLRGERMPVSWPALGAAAAGFALPPAILAAIFAALGAWAPLVECAIAFNARLSLTRNLWIGRAFLPVALALVLFGAWRYRQRATPQRYFAALVAALIAAFVLTLSPLVSSRDFLPAMPLLAIFGAAFLLRFSRPLRALAGTAAVLTLTLFYYADRLENGTAWHVTMMEQALRLTRPGERIMDIKGETIFRRRPFFYAFESITRAQIARGLILDTVAADVVRTRTYVAQADGPMWPSLARAFLNENFVNVGRLRAAGQWINDDGSFTIGIPGDYIVLDERGIAQGVLDGAPHTGARALAAGRHQFLPPAKRGTYVVIWAPAFERGHSPFHLRDTQF